ncbi:polyprenyl synthetase family protein [Candidatus Woesebacteria bacterium]|nr:polyprenyl synthetase family protein [Candidatus Woesebacteria bacterium]
MDAKAYLKDYAATAEIYLKSYFGKKIRQAKKIDPVAADALSILEKYIEGGKKIRGALTVLGYQLAGGKDLKSILPVSVALEIVHSSILIHDDFIDRDLTRRGKPTVHSIYGKKRGGHYGASMAVVVGDVGIFLTHQIFAESNFAKVKVTKALSEFDRFLVNTGYGELMDIEFDFKKIITWDDIAKVRIYKTAHYTFVTPLIVGAILGGAEDKVLKAIKSYGESVGLAFQLRDDILGVFGNEDETGKSAESDIKDGKRTLLFAKAYELAGTGDKDFLKKYYGSAELDKNKLRQIRQIFEKSGALDFTQEKAWDYTLRGKSFVGKITNNPKYKSLLSDLADLMVTREK